MAGIDWSAFLLSQLWSVPYLIVYLVGSVLCLVFWRRHPVVSILSLLAFVILIGSVAIGSALQLWQMGAIQNGSTYADIGRILGIAGIIRTMLGLIAWILLLTALFGWRSAPPAAPPRM